MRIQTNEISMNVPITIYQEGAALLIALEGYSRENAEAVTIANVTPAAVTLIGRETSTTYQISGTAYWRAYHGSEEPDVIWSGVMEARAAYEHQQTNAEETLLLNSVPTLLSKVGLYCSKMDCGNRARRVHMTEDLSRPGAFVVLPICEQCNLVRMKEKYRDDGTRSPDDTVFLSTEQVQELSGGVLYPVGEEG